MLSRLRSVADGLFRRRRFEEKMADEMRFHMEAYAADLMRSGLSTAEGVRRARLAFGAVESAKEECRQSRGLQFADELRQDVRYAIRQMARSPVFTTVAVVSLALGVGANTAIFSLMDAVMFRTMPITEPQRLFYLAHGTGSDINTSANYPLFERYKSAGVLAGVTTYRGYTFTVRTADGFEQVDGQYVSGNYHAVLGVPMAAGRGFSSESDRDVGATPIAVISDAYWSRKFGRSPDAIGKTLSIRGRAVTIVGVTAPSFHGLSSGHHVDLTLPASARAAEDPGFYDDRTGWIYLPIVGRLAPSMTEEQARAALNMVFRRFWLEPENAWARESPEQAAEAAVLIPAAKGSSDLRREYAKPLRVLMGTVVIVLLIACANVANLLLARAASRTREVAVRMGIGAGRNRLIRQFLTESLMLACLGGAVGLIVAVTSTEAVMKLLNTGPESIVLDVNLNARVLAFTVVASIVTGVGFGLVPAFRATRADLTPSLRASRQVDHRGARSATGKTLLVAQIALCVLVIAAAGLLGRSLRNLKTFDTGFARANVVLFNVQTNGSEFTPSRREAFYSTLVTRLGAIPGVASAGLADRSPIDFSSQRRRIDVPGFAPPPGADGVSSVAVTPAYFDAFSIRLVRGRIFTDQDRNGSTTVALVNESMARTYFGDSDPIGRSIVIGGRRDTMTIVGIVRDVRHEEIRAEAPRTVYTSLAQPGISFDGSVGLPVSLTAVIRTNGDPRSLIASAPRYVREVDRDAVISYIRTMDQQLDAALVRERLMATLSTVFALLALLLSAIGLYGVMSYSVARRTRETGIRMALGATRADIVARVIRETLAVSVLGVAIGLGATLMATRAVSTFLFALSPNDPLTLSMVVVLLILTAFIAGVVPALRAAGTDPIRALKVE